MFTIHLLCVRPVLRPGDAVMRISAQMDLMAGGEIVNIVWVFLARLSPGSTWIIPFSSGNNLMSFQMK